MSTWIDRDTACAIVDGGIYWILLDPRAIPTPVSTRKVGASPCEEGTEVDLMGYGEQVYLLCQKGEVFALRYDSEPEIIRSADDESDKVLRLATLDGEPVVLGHGESRGVDGGSGYYYEGLRSRRRVVFGDAVLSSILQRSAEWGAYVWLDRGKEVGSGWFEFDYHWQGGGLRCRVSSRRQDDLTYAPNGFAVYGAHMGEDTRIMTLVGAGDNFGYVIMYSYFPSGEYYAVGGFDGVDPTVTLDCSPLQVVIMD